MESVRVNDPAAVDALLAELPEVLTLEEIADLLRVSTTTVMRWHRDNGLKALVLSERIRRVRKADLHDFLVQTDQIQEDHG